MSLRVVRTGSRTGRRLAALGLLALLAAVETLLPFPAFHTDGDLTRAAVAPATGTTTLARSPANSAPAAHDCLACALLGLSAVLSRASSLSVAPAAVALVAAPAVPHRPAPAADGLRSRAPPAV